MAPVSIPTHPLMGIKSANARKTLSSIVPVNAIFPIRMPTGDGTATRRPSILDIRFICSVPTMQRSVLTCLCISVFWMPGDMTVSVPSSPYGNLKPLIRISLSGISAWILHMTTMPPISFVGNGTSVLLSTSTRTGDARVPFQTLYPLTETAHRCAWLGSAWSTGGTVNKSIPASGDARLPAAKYLPVPARRNVLRPLMAVVSTRNLTGTSGSILLYPEVRMNIRRFTITVLHVKG